MGLQIPRTSHKFILWILLSLPALLIASESWASSDYRWGVAIGYGAEGVSTTSTQTTNSTTGITTGTPAAQRAELPMVAEIYLDRFLSDTMLLTFSHSRGVSFSPFSSEESFTGLFWSWYFLGPALDSTSGEASTLFIKRWTPFVGLGGGVAQAAITRDGTLTPTVSGSGVFLGFRVGFDIPTAPEHGLKVELVNSSTTLTSSFGSTTAAGQPSAVLSAFSVQVGWYWDF